MTKSTKETSFYIIYSVPSCKHISSYRQFLDGETIEERSFDMDILGVLRQALNETLISSPQIFQVMSDGSHFYVTDQIQEQMEDQK